MKPLLPLCLLTAVLAPVVYAQIAPGTGVAGMNVDKVVELDLLTQTELADKIKNGWTSVFLVAGGTEIRGPHAVIGVHNVLATHRAVESARRLGKTIVAPTIPFAVAATGVSEGTNTPGGLQMPADVFKGVQLAMIESISYSGFKDIYVMGDHGSGQNEMKAVAGEMTTKFAAKGIRVHYVGAFYQKTHDDIDMYMYEHKLPIAGHGGMMETAEMMYWEPAPFSFIRPIYKTVPFDGTRFEGASLDADLKAWKDRKDGVAGRGAGGGAPAAPRVNNGLSGNPHFATKEIGKDLAEIGITNTVNQVRTLLAGK